MYHAKMFNAHLLLCDLQVAFIEKLEKRRKLLFYFVRLELTQKKMFFLELCRIKGWTPSPGSLFFLPLFSYIYDGLKIQLLIRLDDIEKIQCFIAQDAGQLDNILASP